MVTWLNRSVLKTSPVLLLAYGETTMTRHHGHHGPKGMSRSHSYQEHVEPHPYEELAANFDRIPEDPSQWDFLKRQSGNQGNQEASAQSAGSGRGPTGRAAKTSGAAANKPSGKSRSRNK
ncbi:hypothetical protein EV182_000730 [Spiromyces aspiralis]|uniref:Uncharacterized protein n=1 Tax=Spiromyces aspiralis TaxID=68401 RepID=A0ACC1HY70_9FUNG|nr:hypothetical protein EV182_000730 [Spiromyces aspiralis]